MKRFVAFLLFLICSFGIAYGESFATPTDLIEIADDDVGEITIPFERKVYLTILKNAEFYGDKMTLVLTLIDFKEDDQYII